MAKKDDLLEFRPKETKEMTISVRLTYREVATIQLLSKSRGFKKYTSYIAQIVEKYLIAASQKGELPPEKEIAKLAKQLQEEREGSKKKS